MSSPFDDLEPTPPVPASRGPERPGAVTVMLRGARRRCPRCGERGLFTSWFRIRPRCPRCSLRLEREEGGFLGAMVLNYLAIAVVWVTVLVVWLAIDLPDVHVAQLTLVSIALALLLPLAFWPFSKTIWAAVDHLVDRSDPNYGTREASDRASGNGGRA
jgi:uncharacterized protein (DUF983 family)